jgi:multiple sugar transport system ATP-binding protein
MRVQMRAEISHIQRRVGVATLYVTHDQTEAMTLGDRVSVLNMGALQQCGTPQHLYDHPDNLFVAGFIGSPAMNLYEATISPSGSEVRVGPQLLSLPARLLAAHPALAAYRDRRVILGIRPESLSDAALLPAPPGDTLSADVELTEALGNEIQLHVTIEASSARSHETAMAIETTELSAAASINAGTSRAEGVARVSPHSTLKAGSHATLAVDTESLHFFDPDTEQAIWA